MVPCGLPGHRHCTVSIISHTLHLRVLNFFLFLSLYHFTELFRFFYYNFIYLFINIIIIICMNIFLKYLRPLMIFMPTPGGNSNLF